MASRKDSPKETPPTLDPWRALELLNGQLEAASSLGTLLTLPKDGLNEWINTTNEFISGAFGQDSPNLKKFGRAGEPSSYALSSNPGQVAELLKSRLNGKVSILKSCITQLEALAQPSSASKAMISPRNERVFLVHGRNEGMQAAVARFIESLDCPVVILHEQPNKGRTIIEKFEDHADVGFAVVLLTGDDKGGLSTVSSESYGLRARQNVILELGYFMGRLGRDRVCALYEAGVEVPSDYAGVMFVELDQNRRWHVELAKELKAAGFRVDMNKVFE